MSAFYAAQELFTGTEWISEVTVEVNNGKIIGISNGKISI